ncbi:MAG: CarD family transcriptional regulator [Deltaproteobacteria bacterium]|nr:CarD family transcriptional regulator [Deltaproteobacteria bacterium]
MQFSIGDHAVYPAHGVGVIQAIETREISGKRQSFYILRILDNEMTVMVPTDNVASVGLREVISKRQVEEIFKILRKRKVKLDHQTWNRRYREYMEKIKTGSVYEIAAVLRDLFLLKVEKELSFGERKMLDTARSLLVKELSLARKVKEETIEKEIQKIFGKKALVQV